MRTWILLAGTALVLLVVPTVLGADSATAAHAAGASLYDPKANCIHGALLAWVEAPAKKGDQFTVWAPPAYAKLASDAASEIRSKDFFGYYEDKLHISSLGYPGQGNSFDIYLDPDLQQALPQADGVNAPRCEYPGRDAVDVQAGIKDTEVFHATLAHELFHAAQAQLGGHFTDNWWYEATATWAETRFGYQTPVPRAFSTEVTDHPRLPMDQFGKAIDGTEAHEYGAWTFVAWLFSRNKIDWTAMRDSFIKAAHADATPIIDQLLNPSSIGDEVASYWADHLNKLPHFGPTAHITVIHDSHPTHVYHVKTAPYLGAKTGAVDPAPGKKQMVLIVKKPLADVQVWIKTGENNNDLLRVEPGKTFEETFCRAGATAGSYDLPKGGVRIAMTTTGKNPPPTVDMKVITSEERCAKEIVVTPGIAIGTLHLGMTVHEAKAAAPRHHLIPGRYHTPFGTWRSGAFNVDGELVIAEFLDGRIAVLIAPAPWDTRVRTTTGIRIAKFHLPRYIPGTDDLATPVILPGSTLAQFGEAHCAPLKQDTNPSRYCWREGPPTRYTIAVAFLVDPCPVDAGEKTPDNDSDVPICDYPKDWYVGDLGVATSRGLKLVHWGSSLLDSKRAGS